MGTCDHQQSGLSYIVLACPKSGTTWMQKMLSEHPQVHCSETRLFGRYFDPSFGPSTHLPLEEYVQILSRYYHPPCEADRREAYFASLLNKMIETIANHAKEESGKPIYGEKLTPYVGTADGVIEQLVGLGPEVRVIHLVRDCRDVIVSGIAHWVKVVDEDSQQELEKSFGYFLDAWVEIEHAIRLAKDQFLHVLEVRYEDMLVDPIAQAQRVFAFIGADVTDDVIEQCVEQSAFSKLSGRRQPGQEDSASFYRSGTAGQWKDKLSSSQLEMIHSKAGALLAGLGYEMPTGTSP